MREMIQYAFFKVSLSIGVMHNVKISKNVCILSDDTTAL